MEFYPMYEVKFRIGQGKSPYEKLIKTYKLV